MEGINTCITCGETKAVTEFINNKNTCKNCRDLYAKQYYIKNKEIQKHIIEDYRKNNREMLMLKQREYRKNNKEVTAANSKKCRIKHKEAIAIRKKEYAIKNKEHIAEKQKQYAYDNKVLIAKKSKEYEIKNKVIIAIKRHKYSQEHSEESRIYHQKRRSLKRKLTSNLTLKQWGDIKNYFDNECCYCGKELPLEQEHFIPLSKLGEYTINNIIPACRSCNCSKNNNEALSWFRNFRYYSKTREKRILKFLNYKNGFQQLKII